MPFVDISNRAVTYQFEIHGKYTIVKGDSAVGKTTLCDLVDAYNRGARGIVNKTSLTISVFPTDLIVVRGLKPESFVNHIFLLDEDTPLLHTHGYEKLLQQFDCYFVFLTRTTELKNIHISADSVYTMHSSGKYHTLQHTFAQFTHQTLKGIDAIITEDSKSGYLFIKHLLKTAYIQPDAYCITGAGNSGIVDKMVYCIRRGCKNVVVMYDYAGMGLYVDSIMSCIQRYKCCNFYIVDWQSFEHYILSSAVLNTQYTLDDSGCTYESLEQFSTTQISKRYPIAYTKGRLIPCLQRNSCRYCSNKDCGVATYKYDDYIYDKIKVIYQFVRANWRARAEGVARITYNEFVRFNKCKHVVNQCHIDATDFVYNLCKCTDVSTNKRKIMYIDDLIANVQSNKFIVTNPSALKNWVGFVN